MVPYLAPLYKHSPVAANSIEIWKFTLKPLVFSLLTKLEQSYKFYVRRYENHITLSLVWRCPAITHLLDLTLTLHLPRVQSSTPRLRLVPRPTHHFIQHKHHPLLLLLSCPPKAAFQNSDLPYLILLLIHLRLLHSTLALLHFFCCCCCKARSHQGYPGALNSFRFFRHSVSLHLSAALVLVLLHCLTHLHQSWRITKTTPTILKMPPTSTPGTLPVLLMAHPCQLL